MYGGLISGVVGINVPVGPAFVGVEGNVTKGFSDIDWEYGVRGRAGVRAGDSGMIFASAGYQWVNGRRAYSDHKRSEEHTSELQSLMRISYAVFCLKKKNQTNYTLINTTTNNLD